MKSDISIIIPIYGSFDTNRLLASIDSLLLQQKCSFEIVVSEQGEQSRLSNLKKIPGLKHIFTKPQKINGKTIYNAGEIRNIGIKNANGKYIYINDADIIFLKKDYLYNLLSEIKEREIFIRPNMWRMLEKEVTYFLKIHKKFGIKFALSKLKFKNNYLATLSNNCKELILIEFDNRIFSSTQSIFKKYTKDHSLKGKENLIWQRLIHCGGIFAKKEYFERIGCYSFGYPVCVYEDSDIQWKFSEKFIVKKINENKKFEVLHLDHNLSYRSQKQEKINKNYFENRKKQGINKAVKEDIKMYKNYFSAG